MTSKISSRWGLDQLPAGLDWGGLEYAVVESPAEVHFLELGEKAPVGEWPCGLAFGPRAELRWLRRAAGYHLVYISDEGKCLAQATASRDLVRRGRRQILLWGESQGDGTFYEGRIPHVLEEYPRQLAKLADSGKRLAVRTQWYSLEENGEETWLFRCVAPQLAIDPDRRRGNG
jgi:hypothetical protein